MSEKCQHVRAVVFDWAGTTIDHGSRAPALVFQEIFWRSGVEITPAQAREPMGMAKRDHIAAILAMPDVAAAWAARKGQAATESDIDALYEEFLPLQKSVLAEHSEVIAGVPDVVSACRSMGLKIGSSTGYTRELMEVVTAAAARQGYSPDCALGAEDAPRGRPAPFLLYEAARRLEVYPLSTIIKVDDTPLGIAAGRNAGCWTVGITRTGNLVGLSAAEIDALSEGELQTRCDAAAQRLRAEGAHYTIESAAEIVRVVRDIDRRMGEGELPDSGNNVKT